MLNSIGPQKSHILQNIRSATTKYSLLLVNWCVNQKYQKIILYNQNLAVMLPLFSNYTCKKIRDVIER